MFNVRLIQMSQQTELNVCQKKHDQTKILKSPLVTGYGKNTAFMAEFGVTILFHLISICQHFNVKYLQLSVTTAQTVSHDLKTASKVLKNPDVVTSVASLSQI